MYAGPCVLSHQVVSRVATGAERWSFSHPIHARPSSLLSDVTGVGRRVCR